MIDDTVGYIKTTFVVGN